MLHTETAIGSAMKRSGFDARGYERRAAAIRLLQLFNGDYGLAVNELRAAKHDMAAMKSAGKGQNLHDTQLQVAVSPPPQDDDAGHTMSDNPDPCASASSTKSAPGGRFVRDTQSHGASGLRPPKPQSKQDIAARIAIEKEAAKTLLATMRTADGKAWGDVGFHELHGMDRDGALARSILALYGHRVANGKAKDQFRPLKDLLSPTEFDAAVAHANGAAND